jgi:hypothetical protein
VGYEPDDEKRGDDKSGLYLEDILIFLSVGALFVLGVLFRNRSWSRPGLIAVLVLMVLVFISRFRRVHKAFKSQE